MNFGRFQKHLFRKTPVSVYSCISFSNNLDGTAIYPDEEYRELLDESDNEFSCDDDDSKTECH